MAQVKGQWKKKSATSKKGTEYTVTQYSNGTSESWACSCPAWTLNRNRPDCKHILQVKLELLQGQKNASLINNPIFNDGNSKSGRKFNF